MALKIDFSYAQSSDLKTLEIYDTTGIYNSTNNVGGWGTPNPQLGSATSDKISIQKSDGSAANEFQMFSTLPNVINQPYPITNVMLGLSALEQIPDGQYQLIRTTIADGVTYRGHWYLTSTVNGSRSFIYSSEADVARHNFYTSFGITSYKAPTFKTSLMYQALQRNNSSNVISIIE